MAEIKTIAVIGAGIMGRGIAHAAALGGYRTILVTDAIASSVPGSHLACFGSVFPRYDEQLEMIDSRTLLAAWNP